MPWHTASVSVSIRADEETVLNNLGELARNLRQLKVARGHFEQTRPERRHPSASDFAGPGSANQLAVAVHCA